MLRKILTFAAIVFWMTTVSRVAQAESGHAYRVDIPFAFVMGDQTMSPGKYEIQVTAASAFANKNFNILILRNRDGREYKALASGLVQPIASTARAELAFQRYGDRAFFTQLRTHGRQIGIPVNKSQVQREIARQQNEEQMVTLFIR